MLPPLPRAVHHGGGGERAPVPRRFLLASKERRREGGSGLESEKEYMVMLMRWPLGRAERRHEGSLAPSRVQEPRKGSR